MAWRVAESLDVLLGQVNALFPKRSKVSDGSIGDAAHASRSSDHNPWLKLAGQPVVTARDYTHHPVGGLDCQKLADALVKSGDKRIKYIIWNRRIWQAGKWTAYTGSNPHTQHLHLSVVANALCDSTTPWNLTGLVSTPPLAPKEDDEMTPEDRKKLNEAHTMLTGIWSQLAGEGAKPGKFTGWPSFEDGSGKRLTVVDYLRQADAQLQKVLKALSK